MDTQTISATEFKARCLDIFDRLSRHEVQRVVITKRGRAVGVLTPPEDSETALGGLHGFMRGSVMISKDLDLTEPVLDEPFEAEQGLLHR